MASWWRRISISAIFPGGLPAPQLPRGHHVFFGALDPRKLTFAERSLRKLPAARAALPEGDFRDWPEIDDWAAGIARELANAA
jgi:hypothetical protein